MGLDMYAFSAKDAPDLKEIDQGLKDHDPVEIFYWRKHHDLHGWMNDLYTRKGGVESFNCTPVRLMPEDLDMLEHAIKNRLMPGTTGFFFGNNPLNNDSDSSDMKFIAKARAEIANGRAVYYDSWW